MATQNKKQTQRDILITLEKALKKNKELRFGQLLMNAAGDNLYYKEDETLLRDLKEYFGIQK